MQIYQSYKPGALVPKKQTAFLDFLRKPLPGYVVLLHGPITHPVTWSQARPDPAAHVLLRYRATQITEFTVENQSTKLSQELFRNFFK